MATIEQSGQVFVAAGRGWWARRCLTLLAGAGLLAGTFGASYEEPRFYLLSMLLGACWTAGWWFDRSVGPPSDSGPEQRWRAVGSGVAAGAVLATCCAAGAIVLRDAPVVGSSIVSVLGSVDGEVFVPVLMTAVLVGVSEELMFRSAVYGWFASRPVVGSTVVYVAVTVATGSFSLLAAAVALGVATGWLRHRTGTLIAPVACHVTWSVLSLAVLPWIVHTG